MEQWKGYYWQLDTLLIMWTFFLLESSSHAKYSQGMQTLGAVRVAGIILYVCLNR